MGKVVDSIHMYSIFSIGEYFEGINTWDGDIDVYRDGSINMYGCKNFEVVMSYEEFKEIWEMVKKARRTYNLQKGR